MLLIITTTLLAASCLTATWVISLQGSRLVRPVVGLIPPLSIRANGLLRSVHFVNLYGPTNPAKIARPPLPGHWKLAFDDEFDHNGLNSSNWSTCYPFACTNNGRLETENYTRAAVSVEHGTAELSAEPAKGSNKPFRSGMLSSDGHFSFTYGYAEIRVHLPKGKGLWPAFWLLPTSETWPPEIDVFEFWGANPSQVMMAVHYGSDARANHVVSDPQLTSGYHTFAINWQPHKITWYIDNKKRFSADVSISTPMYLIANLATLGSPQVDHATSFPATLDIDYIRVFAGPATKQTG